MEKAIIGCGEYKLRPNYSFLAVSEEKWFKLSLEQRKERINKLNTCTVRTASMSNVQSQSQLVSMPAEPSQGINIGRFNLGKKSSLSVLLEDVIGNIKLPYSTAEGIWHKASILVSEVNAVVPRCGPKDKMVKSKSGSVPHFISVLDDGAIYKCDDKCPQYKAIHICSHVVAAAKISGDLDKFLCHQYQRGKQLINLTELATHGMPAGAGCKGGKLPKKKPACM